MRSFFLVLAICNVRRQLHLLSSKLRLFHIEPRPSSSHFSPADQIRRPQLLNVAQLHAQLSKAEVTLLDGLVADRLPFNRLPGDHGVGAVPEDAHLGQPGQQADSSAKKRIVIEVGHSETTLKKVSWGKVLRTSAADELLKVRQQVALLVATRADGVHHSSIKAVISSGGDQG